MHICYGYGIKANTGLEKRRWDSEWRQYEEAFPQLQKSSLDIISLRVPQLAPCRWICWELIRGKKVMVGAIDVASHAIETPEEVAGTLRKALRSVDATKLYPSTNCGMAPLPRHVATGKLHALSAGAEIIRREHGGKVRRGAPLSSPGGVFIVGSLPEQGCYPLCVMLPPAGDRIAAGATALHSGNSASRSQGYKPPAADGMSAWSSK